MKELIDWRLAVISGLNKEVGGGPVLCESGIGKTGIHLFLNMALIGPIQMVVRYKGLEHRREI